MLFISAVVSLICLMVLVQRPSSEEPLEDTKSAKGDLVERAPLLDQAHPAETYKPAAENSPKREQLTLDVTPPGPVAHEKSAEGAAPNTTSIPEPSIFRTMQHQQLSPIPGSIKSIQHPKSQCNIPNGMRKVRTNAGFDMVVLYNDIVSDRLARRGFWEIRDPLDIAPGSYRKMLRTQSLTTFLDIGAHIGAYSFLYASQGYQVIAVEAMTRNRRAMEGTMCLNPSFKDKVQIVPVALVNPVALNATRCVIRSTNYLTNVGNGRLSCGSSVKRCNAGDAHCEEVPVKLLNTVLQEIGPATVDIVKMDAEGYECRVLDGGAELFTKYKPKLLRIEATVAKYKTCLETKVKNWGYDCKANGYDLFFTSKLLA